MATKKNSKNDNGLGKALAAGALMSAAAGAYFLYGSKSANSNRKKVKSWALRAKADVLDNLEKAKEMHKDDYFKVVDNAVRKYAAVRNATEIEASLVGKELKNAWAHIQRSIGTPNNKKKIPASKPKAKAPKKTAKSK